MFCQIIDETFSGLCQSQMEDLPTSYPFLLIQPVSCSQNVPIPIFFLICHKYFHFSLFSAYIRVAGGQSLTMFEGIVLGEGLGHNTTILPTLFEYDSIATSLRRRCTELLKCIPDVSDPAWCQMRQTLNRVFGRQSELETWKDLFSFARIVDRIHLHRILSWKVPLIMDEVLRQSDARLSVLLQLYADVYNLPNIHPQANSDPVLTSSQDKIFFRILNSRGVLPLSYHISSSSLQITRRLDGGGFADIYRAELAGEAVAVKVLRVFNATELFKLRLVSISSQALNCSSRFAGAL